jgi:hypothetical protein
MVEAVKTVAFIITGVAVGFVIWLCVCERRIRSDKDEHD